MNVARRYFNNIWPWSRETFGPGLRDEGIVEHIRKELVEIEQATTDYEKMSEWIDVWILATDALHRHGLTTEEIFDLAFAKYQKNKRRKWPDWRKFKGRAIEHVDGIND